MDARPAIGLAYDLYGGRQTIHNCRGERRKLHRRIYRLQSSGVAVKAGAVLMFRKLGCLALLDTAGGAASLGEPVSLLFPGQ